MSKNDTWMPLDIGDYMADTLHLTTLQHGAYYLLLCHYWKSGPLPDDDNRLSAICKMDAKTWKANRSVIREFFVPNDGLLHQKRADKERAKTAKIVAERSAAGKAGAEARWQNGGNPPDKPDGNRMANASDSHGFATGFATTHLPSTKTKKDSSILSFQEGSARASDRPERVETVRAAAKAEIRALGPKGQPIVELGKKLASRADPARYPLRSRNQQIEEIMRDPDWKPTTVKASPVDPERTPEEQIAILLGEKKTA